MRFSDSDGSLVDTGSATRGEIVTLYFTGAGAVQPAIATAATPSSGPTPVPTESTLVTVGSEKASIMYIGAPSWSVGVVQINFTVPFAAALGVQPVVVSVGGVSSQSATLTLTQ